MGPSIQKETWLYRRQTDLKTLHDCQNTLRSAVDLTKEIVLSIVGEQGRRACCDAKPSRITLKQKVRVTRYCQTFVGNGMVVAGAGSTARVD